MKDSTYKIIEATLSADDSISSDVRQAILDLCRHPLLSGPKPTAARYLSLDVVADRLNVSVRTVQRMITAGKLPSTKIARCRRVAEATLAQLPVVGVEAPKKKKKTARRARKSASPPVDRRRDSTPSVDLSCKQVVNE